MNMGFIQSHLTEIKNKFIYVKFRLLLFICFFDGEGLLLNSILGGQTLTITKDMLGTLGFRNIFKKYI